MDPYTHLDSVDTAMLLPTVLADLDPADYPNIKLVSHPVFLVWRRGKLSGMSSSTRLASL